MNREETAKLLLIVKVYDNRDVNETTVEAWLKITHRLSYQTAEKAVVMFFDRPVSSYEARKPYFDPQELRFWYNKAREHEESEEARRRSRMTPEARQALERQEENARIAQVEALVHGEGNFAAIEDGSETSPEKRAENIAKLRRIMGDRHGREA